ncbi:hypothetical protein SAMN04489712_11424 [Thermomonospora echinospora]|uniref:DDE superfamily endonuclease n=1 Tax=Thermomonospora echinospora TaxID=1992 RepID=A0A1H6D9V7_9ACTN|nr:hypothetical protein [Thermomonospora echinospora]SEG81316.1 hypothetical protein SAMN04489712_11424 [Thermomonospora echinospora]
MDEFGPLNLQPRRGKAWRPTRHPARLRATYHRNDGVRHLLGALDLATGRLYHRSHAEQNAAIGAYVRRRNQHARPKVSFAAGSPIRSWSSYPAKVA